MTIKKRKLKLTSDLKQEITKKIVEDALLGANRLRELTSDPNLMEIDFQYQRDNGFTLKALIDVGDDNAFTIIHEEWEDGVSKRRDVKKLPRTEEGSTDAYAAYDPIKLSI